MQNINKNMMTPSNASTKFNRNILNSIESDSILESNYQNKKGDNSVTRKEVSSTNLHSKFMRKLDIFSNKNS